MARKFTFIIHIGTEKTGTTTIQNYLSRNRSALSSQGFHYARSEQYDNHHHLIRYCQNRRDRNERPTSQTNEYIHRTHDHWKRTVRDSFHSEMNSLHDSIHTVMLSSENFHSRLESAVEVEALRSLIEPYASSFKIIVYIRRQDRLGVSNFSTILKFGNIPNGNIPNQDWVHYYDFSKMLGLWKLTFSEAEITVRPFQPEILLHSNVLEDFLHHTGISAPQKLEKTPAKNRSFSKAGARVMLEFNHMLKRRQKKDNETTKKMRSYLVQQLLAHHPGPPLLPARQEALAFYSIYKTSNQNLANLYLNGKYPFDDDFSNYPEVADSLEADRESASILNALLISYSLLKSEPRPPKKKKLWSIFRR